MANHNKKQEPEVQKVSDLPTTPVEAVHAVEQVILYANNLTAYADGLLRRARSIKMDIDLNEPLDEKTLDQFIELSEYADSFPR